MTTNIEKVKLAIKPLIGGGSVFDNEDREEMASAMAQAAIDAMQPAITLIKTGKAIKFPNVSIGQPFFAYGKVYVKISHDAASVMESSGSVFSGCHNFIIDGENQKEFEELRLITLPQPHKEG